MTPDYPQSLAPDGDVAPAPRRVRGVVARRTVFDTTRALYVWERPYFPQYYIPLADVDRALLVDEGRDERLRRGTARRHGLRVADVKRPGAAHVYVDSDDDRLVDAVRFEWAALDAWFEEDEQIFVHPRNPYARLDAVRSTRRLRVELEGRVLAESSAPVMLFETGLPARYYVDRGSVRFEHLEPSDTVTRCPYKGTTSGYWSFASAGKTVPDIAWTYDFPTREVLPIAGLVAFYNEKVEISLDGVPLERPRTEFS
jgi:uncharacterized protein (DUF427 family)